MTKATRIRETDRWLPERFFKEHLLHFPVVTVDLVVTDRSSRCLLVHRNESNFNWKGIWATPGGRIWRNELAVDSARRVLMRETGLDLPSERFSFCGVHEVITAKEHGVTLVYRVRSGKTRVRPDPTSSSVAWFHATGFPRRLNEEYRKILRMGGVKAASVL
jgi:ADP-ribose pyrophosphatase YjhB (NUDIX family)